MSGMRYQPQGRLRIDRSNPICAGLIFAFNGTGIDAVSGTLATNYIPAVGPTGVGHKVAGASTIALVPGLASPAMSSITLFSLLTDTTVGTGYQGVFGKWANFESNRFAMGLINKRLSISRYPAVDLSFGSNLVSAKVATVAVVQDATSARGFYNGVQIGSSNTAKAYIANADDWCIGTFRTGALSESLPCTNNLSLSWNRALSAEEIRSIHNNPWQVFAESEEDFYEASAVANSYLLTVSSAQFDAAGGNVAMRASRRLRAEPASLAIAPGLVGMRASRKLTVAPAALTLATSDVALLASRRLGVLPAAMAVTGGQVVGRVSRRLPVAPAAMVMTGGQVSMLYAPKPEPGSYTLPVSAAVMALTGGNVGMRVARRLRVTPASLALAMGAARVLARRRLLVSPAGLVLAGGSVTLHFSAREEPFDITKIHPSRIVIFEGSGSRVTPFEGSGSRVTPFGSTGSRTVRFE